jgi:hypothetical protein
MWSVVLVHSRRCCCVLMQTLPSAAQGALTRHIINYIMQDNLFRFYSIYNAQALLRVQRKSCGKRNSIYIQKMGTSVFTFLCPKVFYNFYNSTEEYIFLKLNLYFSAAVIMSVGRVSYMHFILIWFIFAFHYTREIPCEVTDKMHDC